MQNNLTEFLDKAKIAIQRGDKKASITLLNQILLRDFDHAEAWELLHLHFGTGETFTDFQRNHTKKYFPGKLNDLAAQNDRSMRRINLGGRSSRSARDKKPMKESTEAGSQPKKEKKKGFIRRIFDSIRRKPKAKSDSPAQTDQSSQSSGTPPASSSTPTETKQPIRHASLLGSSAPSLSVRDELSITPPPSTLTAPPLSSFGEISNVPDGEKIKVLVVDDIAQTRENLIKLLMLEPSIEIVGGARTGGEGVKMAVEKDPHVVLMDINMPDMDGLEATRLVRSKIPYAQVVILTVQDDPSYMREAIVAGARDFLVKPPMVEELISAVQRAYIIAREEKARMPPPLPAEYTAHTPASKVHDSKRIISVYSPKGGVGCTTLVSNLAVAMQSDTSPVVVVDGCMHFGGVGVAFNERSKHSVLDLTPRVQHLDAEVVGGVLITHAGSSVRLLTAPEKVNDAENVDPLQLAELLKYLSSIFSYVIVDTSSDLTEHTLSVLDASDLVLLVTSQDIPSLDRMRRFLDLAPAIGLNKDRFRLVISRYSDRINITPDRISQNFKQEIAAVIPNDYGTIVPSTNQGTPFMLDKKYKNRPIYKSLADLVDKIIEEVEAV